MSPAPDPARMYDRAATAHATRIMRRYSTSFSLAARLLPRSQARQIAALYAMVRVADEIVDGAWPAASPSAKAAELDAYRERIARAVELGFSSDLTAHAFAQTARATGIGPDEWNPFFAAMRSDADPASRLSLDDYIHGSAEVVGLMCLRIFCPSTPVPSGPVPSGPVPDSPAAPHVPHAPLSEPITPRAPHIPGAADADRLRAGARALGAAFQRVNFLRDLAADQRLGRSYLVPPGEPFTDAARDRQVALIRADLDIAGRAIDGLPRRVRPAVRTAHALFAELTDRLAATPAATIATTRVRVPDARKAQLAAGALTRRATRAS